MHNSWKDIFSKHASPFLVWKVPVSCSLFQCEGSKNIKHFQHFLKNISFVLYLINIVSEQRCLIKLKTACIFWRQILKPFATWDCQWYWWEFLLLWGQRWKLNLGIYILFYLAVVLPQECKWVCDRRCWVWHWSCVELPLPPAWRMFPHPDPASWEANHANAFISDPSLSSWSFGASQVGYGNDCSSYPRSEPSTNSCPVLGS